LFALVIIGSAGVFLGVVIFKAVRKVEAAAAEMVAVFARQPGYRRGATVTKMSRNPLISKAALPDDYVEDYDTMPLPAIDIDIDEL